MRLASGPPAPVLLTDPASLPALARQHPL